MSLIESLKKVSQKRLIAQDDACKEAQAILKPGLKEFMQEHPKIAAVAWTQFTPHFNDGEPCEFGVGGLVASLTFKASEENDEDEDYAGQPPYGEGWREIYGDAPEGFTKKDWKDLEQLETVLQAAEAELRSAFGDGVVVIVTTDGVEVEDYDHD